MEGPWQPFICRAETDSYAGPAHDHLANLFDITGRVLLCLRGGDFFVRPEPVADFHGCLPPHADLLPEQFLPCHLTLSSAWEQTGRIVGLASEPSGLPLGVQTEIDIQFERVAGENLQGRRYLQASRKPACGPLQPQPRRCHAPPPLAAVSPAVSLH